MKIETKTNAEADAVFARERRGEIRIHGVSVGKASKAAMTFSVSLIKQPEMFKPQAYNLRRRAA